MTVAFDATILLPLLNPNIPGPLDSTTGKPLESCRERIDQLIELLEKRREKIIIPTPALSEVLVHSEKAAAQYLSTLRAVGAFKIEGFDERAAFEAAIMIRELLKPLGKKRRKKMAVTWAKAKFDRQIVAIAKVNGATTLYSDDKDLRVFAQQVGLMVVGLAELPLPPKESQQFLPFTRKPQT